MSDLGTVNLILNFAVPAVMLFAWSMLAFFRWLDHQKAESDTFTNLARKNAVQAELLRVEKREVGLLKQQLDKANARADHPPYLINQPPAIPPPFFPGCSPPQPFPGMAPPFPGVGQTIPPPASDSTWIQQQATGGLLAPLGGIGGTLLGGSAAQL